MAIVDGMQKRASKARALTLLVAICLFVITKPTKATEWQTGYKVNTPHTLQTQGRDVDQYSPVYAVSLIPVQSKSSQNARQRENITTLGQKIAFTNPEGYCTLGTTEREAQLRSIAERTVEGRVRVLHIAIQCQELDDYKASRRDTLDNWLQVQLLGARGEFNRLDISRDRFLSAVASASPQIDQNDLNRRLRSAYSNQEMSMEKAHVEILGRDGNAVYFYTRSVLKHGSASRQISGLGATTLINSIPLSINVYEGSGWAGDRERIQLILRQILTRLLLDN